jgi:RNA polymerase sigma-70 factor (ECF subfamily)
MTLSGEVGSQETRFINSARQGDTAAWEPLVRHYQTPVFRLAYLILGDSSEAEDVTQEVFIRAFLSLTQYDAERPFRPWLMSIAANLARNRRRSIGRYWAALRRYWQTEKITDSINSESESEARRLWQAVRQLRPAAQEIVYLRYFLALSEAETAAALNIAPGTAKSRLHRALKQLRAVIEVDFPDLREMWYE